MEPAFLRPAAIPGPLMSVCVLAGVLIVHPTQPGAFHDIQSACNAAAERDTILVEAGTYPTFEVVDKWLTIASDNASVTVSGGARVRNLQAGKRVTLVGLTLTGGNGGSPATRHGLELISSMGPIRIDHSDLGGASYVYSVLPDGGDGLRVAGCADVAVGRSQIHGGLSAYGYGSTPLPPGTGGAGVRAIGSSVVVYDCLVSGGWGANGTSPVTLDGGDAGPGCRAISSTLLASRSMFYGGVGGDGWAGIGSANYAYGGSGGDGIRLESPSCLARLVSTMAYGGTGGFSYGPMWVPGGTVGNPYLGGQFVDLGSIGRSMSVSADPIRESTSAMLTMTGHPGDRVGFFVSTNAASTFNSGWHGQQLFPDFPAPLFVDAGVLPQSGMLTYNLPFPDLGAGVAARTFLIQPVFSSATVRLVLGTPVPLVVLDSAY
jgi:hypothetical protein